MRVITWNMRRATKTSAAWKILADINPDVALLQEVTKIPENIKELFKDGIKFNKAIGKTGKPQQFGTAVFVKGNIIDELPLSSEYKWRNLVSCVVQPTGYPKFNIISVHSPHRPIDTSQYPDIDIAKIRLTAQKKEIWLTEILWSALKNAKKKADFVDVPWIVGGDFNSSETFDIEWQDQNSVRFGIRSSGNKEILDRMEALGFTECLKKHNGKLTPTFKNPRGGKIIHQIDHLFATDSLFSQLKNCTVGDEATIFGKSVSDHLPIIADFENLKSVPSYIEKFIDRNTWVFAKTMAEIPHYYIVRDNLSENDKKLFDEFDVLVKENGYTKKFYSKQYTYYNIGNYKYWVIENILNRAELELKK